MRLPQAVIFDLGKVLVDFDYGIAIQKFASRCSLPEGGLHKLINQSALLFQYETGLLTTEQFFSRITSAAGYGGSFDEFSVVFGDIFTPVPEMVQLPAELRAKGLPTYLFSNTNDLAIRHIRARFPFIHNFEGCFLSYEHKLMKPDVRFYRIVEGQTGRTGAELLYLDDRPENVAAGDALGWQTILHRSPEETRAALRRLGLLPQVDEP
ncbi:MAG: HAD family phosphatase [Verrucomicrobiota bacterium]